ncbi:hypothetical protein [Acetobacter persici]|uniref:hypothetical protein n=1 Tax=Acetobacter persici TaxID=1076596 RepID=UPI001FCFF59A|nr:hypothetical protein [Acetobacter persici]
MNPFSLLPGKRVRHFVRQSVNPSGFRSARTLPLAGLAVLALLCGAAGPAADDPYGEWIGTLVAEKGHNCPVHTVSLMQIQPKHITFTPEMGALVLRGVPDKKTQHYHAQLILQDSHHQQLPMVFEAHPVGDTFEGVYGTPECRAHVTLKRPEGRAWKNFMGND